jgi:hypothetical protein
VKRREPVVTEYELEEIERGWAVMWTPGQLSRRVPPVHSERDGDREWWTWPVSDTALRIWAEREGVDPDAAVAWSHERFPNGERRYGPPPAATYADAEAYARGTYVTPRERRLRGPV